MSARIAMKGGSVQLEQSDTHLSLKKAKMFKVALSHAGFKVSLQPINKPLTQLGAETKQGFQYSGLHMVKAAIDTNQVMVYNNHIAACLQCQNGIGKNWQSRWRHNGPDTPQPDLVGHPWELHHGPEKHMDLVLGLCLGNPPTVWVLTTTVVQIQSRPSQKHNPMIVGGVVTRTGHKPAVLWFRSIIPQRLIFATSELCLQSSCRVVFISQYYIYVKRAVLASY